MDKAKRNRIVAKASGLTEGEVDSYLAEVIERLDGSWLVYFGQEVERDREAAAKLPASKTIEVSKEEVCGVGGYDHDNG